MTILTKVAEAFSGLLLLLLALRNPHLGLPLVPAVESLAAFFIAWSFPKRPAASVVALVLAPLVVASVVVPTWRMGMPDLHSPMMGFAFLPLALLLIAQLVAAANAFSTLRSRKAAA